LTNFSSFLFARSVEIAPWRSPIGRLAISQLLLVASAYRSSHEPSDKVSPTADRSRHRASVLQEGQKGENIRASLVVIRAIPVKTAQ
jgi:hypothetical protein